MKKGIIILSLIAAIGLTAFALFKTLTNKQDGTDTKTNPETIGEPIEEARPQGSEETGAGVNSQKD